MRKISKDIRFFLLTLAVSVSVLAGVASFNLKHDYANVFVSKGMYEQFTWYLSQNKYVVGPQHFADRFLRIAMIKAMPVPDVAILGSSRIFKVHGDLFKGQSFMNLGGGWSFSAGLSRPDGGIRLP